MRLLKVLIPVALLLVIVIIVVPVAVVFSRSVETDDYPVVSTNVGSIRGLRNQDGSSMFLGIPYASVDENNPFGAPAIVHPIFEDVFNAFNDSARCPQVSGLEQTSLDCLHLNIYVPQTTDDTPLPVLVYFHGGRFVLGAAQRNIYNPNFLIRHNIIFVSLNYRLSAYGFMCLNTPEVPGNQGLKDQHDALRWIKNNIRAFGGNDESITIAGDSAGGVSVDLQLMFAEKGLIHRVITQSGTALSPWAVQEPDLNAALMIAGRLGFETNDTSTAMSFLSNQTSSQVMSAVAQLEMRFQPCVEQDFPNVVRFITSHPVSTSLPQATSIPLLSGYHEDEWLMVYGNMPAEAFEGMDIFNKNMHLGFAFGDAHDDMKLFVRRFYAADEPMSENLRRAIIDFESDFLFLHPTQRSLGKYLDYGGTAYHYLFTYIGGRNWMRVMNNFTDGGSTHSDELGYLFDLYDFKDTPTPEDQLMIDRITTLWTNFAKYGNPTPSTTELLPVQWLPVTRDRLHYINLTTNITLSTRPFHRRLSFWDFFYNANRNYVKGFSNNM